MLIFGICLEKPKQEKPNSFQISVDLRHRVDLRTILKDLSWWSGNTELQSQERRPVQGPQRSFVFCLVTVVVSHFLTAGLSPNELEVHMR